MGENMPKRSRPNRRISVALSAICLLSAPVNAQEVSNFIPVTPDMLTNPDPADWLMFSRTYDAQRYSPLEQINKDNVKKLRMVWSRGMDQGRVESIPLVYDGVMYVLAPGAQILALDATNGDRIWAYQRPVPAPQRAQARSKTLAIYQDMIYHTATDGFVVALDARTVKCAGKPKLSAVVPLFRIDRCRGCSDFITRLCVKPAKAVLLQARCTYRCGTLAPYYPRDG